MENIKTRTRRSKVDCAYFRRCGLYKIFPDTEPKERYRPKFGSADECTTDCRKYIPIDEWVEQCKGIIGRIKK